MKDLEFRFKQPAVACRCRVRGGTAGADAQSSSLLRSKRMIADDGEATCTHTVNPCVLWTGKAWLSARVRALSTVDSSTDRLGRPARVVPSSTAGVFK